MSINVEKVEVAECICERCGHSWIADLKRDVESGKIVYAVPIACPGCKSAYWSRPRVRAQKKRK